MSDRNLLILAAIGLFPIALSYGVVPSTVMPSLLSISVETIELTHVFRALMGLYLAMLTFWLLGAFNPKLSVPALWSVFIFMTGLAGGRLLSLVVDGWPGFMLILYLMAEILFAALVWVQLRKHV